MVRVCPKEAEDGEQFMQFLATPNHSYTAAYDI
jgi:hypothetical protein